MPAAVTDPAAWFDTIKPIDPPAFTDEHPFWCVRHYAPAVRLAGNGTGATLELSRTVITLIRAALPAGTRVTTGQIREYLAGHCEPACCILGDDRVYSIWAGWLP